MPLRVRVCRVDDVAPGAIETFEVDGVGVPILVAHIDGRLFASSSICPHEDVSLADGSRRGTRLTCPGHAYEFDLATGRCSHDPDLHLKTYAVTVEDGEVFVDLV